MCTLPQNHMKSSVTEVKYPSVYWHTVGKGSKRPEGMRQDHKTVTAKEKGAQN